MNKTNQQRRRFVQMSGGMVATVVAPVIAMRSAWGQTWKPQGTVKIIVASAPGGATDIFARIVAEQLVTKLGRPVVVENKPGASGMIGTGYAYRATDGLTFFTGSSDNITLAPHVQAKLDHDPMAMIPVAPLGTIDVALSVRNDLPVATLTEFVAYAKSNKLNYAHWGAGALGHVMVEAFKASTGIRDMQGIPYAGSAPGVQALISGQVDAMPVPLNQAIGFRKQMKVLANFGSKRFEGLADVPTMREAGVDFSLGSWLGVFAPPKTPQEIVDTLHAAISEITATPAYLQKLKDSGMLSQRYDSAAGYARFIRSNYELMGAAVKASGYKPEAA